MNDLNEFDEIFNNINYKKNDTTTATTTRTINNYEEFGYYANENVVMNNNFIEDLINEEFISDELISEELISYAIENKDELFNDIETIISNDIDMDDGYISLLSTPIQSPPTVNQDQDQDQDQEQQQQQQEISQDSNDYYNQFYEILNDNEKYKNIFQAIDEIQSQMPTLTPIMKVSKTDETKEEWIKERKRIYQREQRKIGRFKKIRKFRSKPLNVTLYDLREFYSDLKCKYTGERRSPRISKKRNKKQKMKSKKNIDDFLNTIKTKQSRKNRKLHSIIADDIYNKQNKLTKINLLQTNVNNQSIAIYNPDIDTSEHFIFSDEAQQYHEIASKYRKKFLCYYNRIARYIDRCQDDDNYGKYVSDVFCTKDPSQERNLLKCSLKFKVRDYRIRTNKLKGKTLFGIVINVLDPKKILKTEINRDFINASIPKVKNNKIIDLRSMFCELWDIGKIYTASGGVLKFQLPMSVIRTYMIDNCLDLDIIDSYMSSASYPILEFDRLITQYNSDDLKQIDTIHFIQSAIDEFIPDNEKSEYIRILTPLTLHKLMIRFWTVEHLLYFYDYYRLKMSLQPSFVQTHLLYTVDYLDIFRRFYMRFGYTDDTFNEIEYHSAFNRILESSVKYKSDKRSDYNKMLSYTSLNNSCVRSYLKKYTATSAHFLSITY
jgi:hypothetical protein